MNVTMNERQVALCRKCIHSNAQTTTEDKSFLFCSASGGRLYNRLLWQSVKEDWKPIFGFEVPTDCPFSMELMMLEGA